MSEKVLSIIIPTYNMENYISKCLDSLLIPSIDLIEVLVINDGSKDESSAIAHQYKERFPNSIRVIDKENGNYGSCINRGLKEVTGRYVKILDADDTFDTKNFEEFVKFISQNDTDCIITNYIQINSENKELNKVCFNIHSKKTRIPFNKMPKKLLRDIQMHAVTYKTKILIDNNYFQTEGISYTDNEWVFLPLAWCKSFVYYPYVIYRYLIGREGQTVDPSSRDKSFHHSLEGLETELNHLESRTIDKIEIHKFLVSKFTKRLDNIYKLGISGTPNMRSKLADFDKVTNDRLLKNRIYLSKSLTIPLMNYNYIEKWRKMNYNQSFKIPRYIILIEKILKRINLI